MRKTNIPKGTKLTAKKKQMVNLIEVNSPFPCLATMARSAPHLPNLSYLKGIPATVRLEVDEETQGRYGILKIEIVREFVKVSKLFDRINKEAKASIRGMSVVSFKIPKKNKGTK